MSNHNNNSTDQLQPSSRRTYSRRNKRMNNSFHSFEKPFIVTDENGARYAVYLPKAEANNPNQPTKQLTPGMTQYYSPHVKRPHRRSSDSLKERLAQHVGPLNTENLPMRRISKLLRTKMAKAVDHSEDEEMGFAWKLIDALLTKRTKLSQQDPCRLEFASAYDLWETLTQDFDKPMVLDYDDCGGDEETKRKNDKEPNSPVINPMSQSSILTVLASSDSCISGVGEGITEAMSNHDWMNVLLLAAFSPSTHERTKVLSR